MNGEINLAIVFHAEGGGETLNRENSLSIPNVSEKDYDEVVKRIREIVYSFPKSGDMTE